MMQASENIRPAQGSPVHSVHVTPLRDLGGGAREAAALERSPKLARIKELYLGDEPMTNGAIARKVTADTCDCSTRSVKDAVTRWHWAEQRRRLDAAEVRLTRRARAEAGLEAADRRANPKTPEEILAAGKAILDSVTEHGLAAGLAVATGQDLELIAAQMAGLGEMAAEIDSVMVNLHDIKDPAARATLSLKALASKLELKKELAALTERLIKLRRSILLPPAKDAKPGAGMAQVNIYGPGGQAASDPAYLAELEAQKRQYDVPAHGYRVLPAPLTPGVLTRADFDAQVSGEFQADTIEAVIATALEQEARSDSPPEILTADLAVGESPALSGGGSPATRSALLDCIATYRQEYQSRFVARPEQPGPSAADFDETDWLADLEVAA